MRVTVRVSPGTRRLGLGLGVGIGFGFGFGSKPNQTLTLTLTLTWNETETSSGWPPDSVSPAEPSSSWLEPVRSASGRRRKKPLVRESENSMVIRFLGKARTWVRVRG